MDKLLSLLENDAKLTAEQLAVMLDKETGDIKKLLTNTSARASFSAIRRLSTGIRPTVNM